MAIGVGLITACVAYAEIPAQPTVRHAPLFHATAAEVLPAPKAPSRQAMPAKERFAVIVERPLFSPSRQPPSEQPFAASAPRLNLSLIGVVISTEQPVALVKLDADSGPLRVNEGDEISGWRVVRIDPERILVRRDVMERELLLEFTAPALPPPQPIPPSETDGFTDDLDS
jgi:type II secretory pathway component PulC